jgi:hypothetical protein
MPVVFEEITGEVAPERGAEAPQATPPAVPADGFDPAELMRRELQLMREREHRLVAD